MSTTAEAKSSEQTFTLARATNPTVFLVRILSGLIVVLSLCIGGGKLCSTRGTCLASVDFLFYPNDRAERYSKSGIVHRSMEELLPPSNASFLHRWYYVSSSSFPTDKNSYHRYAKIYDTYLNNPSFRTLPISLLEVGVCRGGSLMAFREYLSPSSHVLGLDASRAIPSFLSEPGITTFGGVDSKDALAVKAVVEEIRERGEAPFPFSVVVDDGDHRAASQRRTFELFFPSLRAGGFYFVEDVDQSTESDELAFYAKFGKSTLHRDEGGSSGQSLIVVEKGEADVRHG